MDKYYTPELEEFHPGFQFQYLKQTGEWTNHIFCESKFDNPELDEYDDYLMKWTHAVTRCKYLDREDIESLGWEVLENVNDVIKARFKRATHYRNGGVFPELVIKCNTSEMYIKAPDTIFSGFIKNKSELKKLMKQLNINNG